MTTVAEAKKLILEQAAVLAPLCVQLNEASGMVLAKDIYASIDIPAFAQSSMDGYAFSFDYWKANKSLKIKGEMAAGSSETMGLPRENAVRIFTGAAVPAGADTVVMQEKTIIENGLLVLEDNIVQGSNIRALGSEIKAGELALPKDTLLLPAAVGFLAGIGITQVFIYPLPYVSIIVTGNELQAPGLPLMYGQVYESNSFSLQAALKQLHIQQAKIFRADDTLEAVRQVIEAALQQSDIVFLTGGVSVGDYDFVIEAAAKNGVEKVFHKVKQRPGKPFFFGKKESKLVFGLPGNPASVLTCFYEYIEPALKQISKQETGIRIIRVPIATPYKKAAGLTHFLKGFYDGRAVTPLTAQESYRLSSFAKANCLVQVNEEVTECEKDEMVEIHLIPG